MKFSIFFLILLFLGTACGKNKEVKKLHNQYYNRDKTEFRLIRFYKTKKRIQEVELDTLGSLVEYYKFYFQKGAKFPFKEEYFKNQRLIEYKEYNYKDGKGVKPEIKNIKTYNRMKKLVNEEIRISQEKTVRFEYIYHKELKNLLIKKRFLNGKPDGRWIYYGSNGETVKEEFYTNGVLLEYWLYYHKNGKRIREEKYNAESGSLIYSHEYK